MLHYRQITLLVSFSCLAFIGCKKGFLDEKPSSNIVQPNTIEDLQGLLDNYSVFNADYPALPQLAADDYYFLSKSVWESARTAVERSSYIWDKDVYGGEMDILSWKGAYRAVFYANSVLENSQLIERTTDNAKKLDEILGAAHFFRAFAYYELTKNYGKAYNEGSAATDLGVPLKLSANISEIVQRSSVKECYDQILGDLTIAKEKLFLKQPNPARNRPSKLAAYALYARIYLGMRKYDLAYQYADSVLTNYNKLIDYNTVSTSASAPFSITNDETIISTCLSNYTTNNYRNANRAVSVDTLLFKSYEPNDLRKVVYFNMEAPGIYSVRRGYFGSGLDPYNGLAVDEIYLIKAECAARDGKTEEAMGLLNELLIKRYKSGTFVPLTASTAMEAKEIVLMERRKELVWRALRWEDLKRLNMEGANITLKRDLDGAIYELAPNSPRWIFNIPQDEINYSGIQQNER